MKGVSMFYRSMVFAAAGVMLAMTQAGAATYTYTGIPSPGDTFVIPGDPSSGVAQYYVSATVDLNCAGPCSSGTYSEGGLLTSLTLSIDGPSPSNVTVYSLSNTTPGYVGGDNPNGLLVNNYVTLSNMGGVISITNWSVFADLDNDPGLNFAIYTVGNDPTDGTQDYYADNGAEGGIASGTLDANPGVWSGPGIAAVNATPLPAALPLFAGGLGMIGLIAGRKKRKAPAIAAA
jgi:hypothetical protein